MPFHRVPQPGVERLVPPAGRPLVVGVMPDQSELVALTAAAWSEALGGVGLYFGYVDRSRTVDEEFGDGTVRHSDLDPDRADDSWREQERRIRGFLEATLARHAGPWEFRYLAGRPDRALTHLARAVDASAIVVGARRPRTAERARDVLDESVALRLGRHQHRPVLIVPLAVVDWKAPSPW